MSRISQKNPAAEVGPGSSGGYGGDPAPSNTVSAVAPAGGIFSGHQLGSDERTCPRSVASGSLGRRALRQKFQNGLLNGHDNPATHTLLAAAVQKSQEGVSGQGVEPLSSSSYDEDVGLMEPYTPLFSAIQAATSAGLGSIEGPGAGGAAGAGPVVPFSVVGAAPLPAEAGVGAQQASGGASGAHYQPGAVGARPLTVTQQSAGAKIPERSWCCSRPQGKTNRQVPCQGSGCKRWHCHMDHQMPNMSNGVFICCECATWSNSRSLCHKCSQKRRRDQQASNRAVSGQVQHIWFCGRCYCMTPLMRSFDPFSRARLTFLERR